MPDHVEAEEDSAHLQVIRLRATLRQKLADYKVACITDLVRWGVWVLRPVYGRMHNRDVVGPAKEDEVRSRPVDEVEEGPVPILRQVARVLMLDPGERVLLLRTVVDLDIGDLWLAPGGPLERGETFEAAALRTVRNLSGLSDVRLGPCVWSRTSLLPKDGKVYEVQERFFAARTGQWEVSREHWTDRERETLVEHRWWTVGELRGSRAVFVPRELATLLGSVRTL